VKRRAVGIFLLVFAVWPLVQFGLTQRYDVSPWKLFGWAMYCVPGAMKTVRIGALSDAPMRRLDFQAYAPEEQVLADTFRLRRQALGRLASPEALAEGMLELHPDVDGVLIAVLTLRLGRESARVLREMDYTTHWRDGREEPMELSVEVLGNLFGP
jgi:hypothetical protein